MASEGHRVVMSGPNFIDVVKAATTIESAAASDRARKILTGEGEPVRLDTAEVSASLFDVLRVRPALGRTFAPDENTPGRTNVIVLSHGLWQQRFGSDPGVIGKTIQLDGERKEIVGVMPAGFAYPTGSQAWLPIEYEDGFVHKQRASWYLSVIARLKPGVTAEQSAAEVQTIGHALENKYKEANENVGMNFYTVESRMGVHQDKDESQASIASGAPIVSLSLGDAARFVVGGLTRRERTQPMVLRSGDVLLMGGASRLRFHGVTKILPGTAPHGTGPGRFNLTFRQW